MQLITINIVTVVANLFYDLVFAAMILMYLTYTWGNSVHEQGKRKNPADFENDE